MPHTRRPANPPGSPWCATVLAILLAVASVASVAAPFRPADDRQVLEHLPERGTDPRLAQLRQWRVQLQREPGNATLALQVARAYHEQVAAEGDPRYIGYAQAALAPWWAQAAPPPGIRVMRAVLRQWSHDFEAARADLQAVTQLEPGNGEAWSWLAAIAMVQARYDDARRACAGGASQASALIATACVAAVDSVTGHATAAADALRQALAQATDATAAEQLWALTRLAETEARRGNAAAAEASFRRALALGLTDGYLLAAYADFLLDRQRPAEVLTLLKGQERADLLLLRLALAAQAARSADAARWSTELSARFDAARLRGDTVHQKEEARHALALLGDAPRALRLAQANFAVQREPADARMLLEAALAARSPQAAEPALAWMRSSGIESVALQRLAQGLQALR